MPVLPARIIVKRGRTATAETTGTGAARPSRKVNALSQEFVGSRLDFKSGLVGPKSARDRPLLAVAKQPSEFARVAFAQLSSEFKLAWKLDFCRHFRRAAEENSHPRKASVEDNDTALGS
jgi:hypothetical protein